MSDLKGDHQGDCGLATTVIGSRSWGYPGDWRHVTPGPESGRGLPWAMVVRTHVQGLGRESPWRMWTCDPGTGSWKGHHDGNCGCVTPGTMSGRMVTVETVDM